MKMYFFSNFAWGVSHAFAQAVGQCSFQQGDVLHIGDGKRIQVTYPPRRIPGYIESKKNIFQKNWNSKILLLGIDIVPIETTQGRLYTALWHGDLSILNMDTNNPPIPREARQITKQLDQARQKALEISDGFPVFVMVKDRSNKLSTTKYLSVYLMLKNYLSCEPYLIAPCKAGIQDWQTIAPSAEIAFFPVNLLTHQELEIKIKKALYKPNKNTKKQMFNINRHGRIFI